MPDFRNQVRPNSQRLTDEDARHLLADGLLRFCHREGPARVGLIAGCDEKTIRRARDEKTTLKLANALNLLDGDPHALDALLAAKGFILAPMMTEAPDLIASAGAAIHRIATNRAAHSAGGEAETDHELIAGETENDALLAAMIAAPFRDQRSQAAEVGSMTDPIEPEDFAEPEELQTFADNHDFREPRPVWAMIAVWLASVSLALFAILGW